MNPNPLTEAELDRLEALLEDDVFDGECMLLDEVQAMLCAVVSGPEVIPPSVWLPEVFGPGMDPQRLSAAGAPDAAGNEVLAELLSLLLRYHNEIAADLQADETVSPIVYPLDESEEEYDFRAWADAYILGAGLGGDWYELAGKRGDDLTELLEPMFLLNGMLKEDALERGERWFLPAEEARMLQEVQENLPAIVQTLYNFWRHRKSGAVQTAPSDKVGRNDPCPCGSGKKFKQCCGHPERLN